MEEQKIICTVGIPACGKSTWADTFVSENSNFIKVERDEIRANHFTSTGNLWDYRFSSNKENAVTKIQEDEIRIAIEQGKSIIIADTNLNKKTVGNISRLAASLGVALEFKEFDVPLYQAIKWNRNRPDHVPESVLISMERNMRQFLGKYVQTPEVRSKELQVMDTCVIMDIDGTLADMRGIRGPYDWDKVHFDKPVQHVVDYAKYIYHDSPHDLIIFTGRDGVCKGLTQQWLQEQGIDYHGLYIRPEGNTENDSIIKEKMFDNHICNRYSVDHIVDDRKQVCCQWQAMGFNVMNVGGFLSDF